MLIDNTNVINVMTLPTSNGTAPFTHVEVVIKLHQDMHYEHAVDLPLMMDSAGILTLKKSMMETSLESADQHMLFVYICFFLSKFKKSNDFVMPPFPFFQKNFIEPFTECSSLPLQFLTPSFFHLLINSIHWLYLSNTTSGSFLLPTYSLI
jgi:hypothetical protein